MMNDSDKNKVEIVQCLRGVAVLLVVWFHSIVTIDYQAVSIQSSWGFIDQFGAVGVDIFFVISGFVVYLSASNSSSVSEFFVKRILRIWPLYFVATLAYLLVMPAEAQNIGRIVASLLFIEPFNTDRAFPTLEPGWSLMFEVAFYSIVACAMLWRSVRPLPERILILFGIMIVASAIIDFPRPMNVFGNPIALEFVFGVLIAWVWSKYPVLPVWVTSLTFVSSSVIFLSTALYGNGNVFEGLGIIDASKSWDRVRVWGVSSALLLASAVFREHRRGVGGLWVFLGNSSFSIYLFHMHVVMFFRWREEILSWLQPDFQILLVSLLSIFLGVFCFYVIERPLMVRARPVSIYLAGQLDRAGALMREKFVFLQRGTI